MDAFCPRVPNAIVTIELQFAVDTGCLVPSNAIVWNTHLVELVCGGKS